MDLIKNPIVIGLLMATATYIYMSWDYGKQNEKNPKAPKKEVGLLIPILVGIIGWFLAYGYFDTSPLPSTTIEQNKSLVILDKPSRLSKDDNFTLSSDLGKKSYHLIGKSIKLPNNIPDVFLETYS
ncbi:MAG: hypothetical protein Edafosvirus8_7 [Edafosvirus sp.]|uniref:Uncharacterized protein n=1 Tax=Edafosvirus sp. TaxID=2487765 RepID=A0A3G4ZTP2_9VIRU|nr:MAG: hypothetical protein Edafosvirus8_7 [Edafosvirus sp.]